MYGAIAVNDVVSLRTNLGRRLPVAEPAVASAPAGLMMATAPARFGASAAQVSRDSGKATDELHRDQQPEVPGVDELLDCRTVRAPMATSAL